MADPNQVLAAEPAGAETTYRPVSGLAIAGLSLAGVYVLLVVVSTVAALIQGASFFLPNALLLLPMGGALLCFLAQRQIRASEGTRAGLVLARWGLWLSVFTGFGYTAYYVFTRLAVIQQANAFLLEKDADSGFFPLLQEGGPVQVNMAYLLTEPEYKRGNVKPENMKQMTKLFDQPGRQGLGQLTFFRQHYLVEALRRGGKDCKIEPQGVHEWNFEKGGYKVVRIYRITTPEATIRAIIPVHSTEGDAGGVRKWYVVFQQLAMRIEYTPLGQALKGIDALARVYLDTELHQPTSTGSWPDKTDWQKITQGDPRLTEARDGVREILNGKGPEHMFQLGKGENLSPWRIENGKPQFDFAANLRFRFAGIPMSADCNITVECLESVVPPGQAQPDPAHFPEQPRWRIKSFEVVRMGLMMAGPK